MWEGWTREPLCHAGRAAGGTASDTGKSFGDKDAGIFWIFSKHVLIFIWFLSTPRK